MVREHVSRRIRRSILPVRDKRRVWFEAHNTISVSSNWQREREMFFDISPNSKVAERGEWNGWNSGEIGSFYLAALHVCEFARWDERKLLSRTVPRPKATMHA